MTKNDLIPIAAQTLPAQITAQTLPVQRRWNELRAMADEWVGTEDVYDLHSLPDGADNAAVAAHMRRQATKLEANVDAATRAEIEQLQRLERQAQQARDREERSKKNVQIIKYGGATLGVDVTKVLDRFEQDGTAVVDTIPRWAALATRAPLGVVVAAMAEVIGGGSTLSYEIALGDLQDYAREHEQPPRCFLHEAYSTMAEGLQEYVLATAGVPITADERRKFFVGNEPVPTARVEALAHQYLSTAEIWNPDRHKDEELNNRIIREVLGALRRMYPRIEGTVPRAADMLAIAHDAQSDAVAAWLGERCTLGPDNITPKAALLANYRAWCAACGALPEPEARFFERLYAASGGKISTSRPRGSKGRVRACTGIAVRGT